MWKCEGIHVFNWGLQTLRLPNHVSQKWNQWMLFNRLTDYMHVISHVSAVRQVAVCASASHGQKFNVGCQAQTFPPNSFIPFMLIDTINLCHLYHFQWPWLWLKVSEKQNLLGSISCSLLSWSAFSFLWSWKNFNWMSCHHVKVRMIW